MCGHYIAGDSVRLDTVLIALSTQLLSTFLCVRHRSLRNLYNRLIRISKIAYFSELVETYRGNINQTWRVLKTLGKTLGKSRDKTNCRIFEINGSYTENSAEISKSFCNYFTHIGQQCSAAIGQSLKQYKWKPS